MKVLLVDDHALFREGLRSLFERLDQNFEIFEAGDCTSAFELANRHADLGFVLLDLGLPDMPGMDAIRVMRQRYPSVPVVVLSASEDRASVLEAINCGAMGFIPKSSNSTLLMNALRLVLANGVYVPPSVLTKNSNAAGALSVQTVERKDASLRELGLTDRQIEVLRLVVQGLPNKLIGRKLNLSEATIKSHVTAVLRALNVTNRTQAVLAVAQLGYSFASSHGTRQNVSTSPLDRAK
jgi:DNA-binding NarL/FixJ family response regulator